MFGLIEFVDNISKGDGQGPILAKQLYINGHKIDCYIEEFGIDIDLGNGRDEPSKVRITFLPSKVVVRGGAD